MNMIKHIFLSILLTFFILEIIELFPWTWAYVSSSPNFRIEYDSINNEGGFSNSSNFNLEDTMGEHAIGISDSDNFKIKAGFQQMREVNLSVSTPDDVPLSPSIGGLTGGTADGQVSWTVTTDNPGGYSLSIKSAVSPALASATSSIGNYTPAGGTTPDFSWSVASSDSEFGFSPEGTDIVSKFKDNGFNTCATGENDTPDKCWYNFSTTNETISESFARNDPSGTDTTFKLKAEVGSSHNQEEGNYTASITVTAVAN